jgi:hypothetical protein
MTEITLQKGREIQGDIAALKNALSDVAKVQLFRIDESGCSASFRSQADPFLAELQTDLRTLATKRINKHIAALEKEFKSL